MSTVLKTATIAVTLGLALNAGAAAADERYQPISDPAVLKECGSCHMPFQPQMLPARSWERIMDTLDNHFGENAALDPATAKTIRAYLVKYAADSKWWGSRFMRGINAEDTPMRITETPYWVREHGHEVPARLWTDPRVKSKANCQACHPRAARGNYDDD